MSFCLFVRSFITHSYLLLSNHIMSISLIQIPPIRQATRSQICCTGYQSICWMGNMIELLIRYYNNITMHYIRIRYVDENAQISEEKLPVSPILSQFNLGRALARPATHILILINTLVVHFRQITNFNDWSRYLTRRRLTGACTEIVNSIRKYLESHESIEDFK